MNKRGVRAVEDGSRHLFVTAFLPGWKRIHGGRGVSGEIRTKNFPGLNKYFRYYRTTGPPWNGQAHRVHTIKS